MVPELSKKVHVSCNNCSSFQAGIYFKIHLQMLKTLAFHYLLSVIVAKVFKLNKQDVICRAMLTIKLTGGNGAQGNSR